MALDPQPFPALKGVFSISGLHTYWLGASQTAWPREALAALRELSCRHALGAHPTRRRTGDRPGCWQGHGSRPALPRPGEGRALWSCLPSAVLGPSQDSALGLAALSKVLKIPRSDLGELGAALTNTSWTGPCFNTSLPATFLDLIPPPLPLPSSSLPSLLPSPSPHSNSPKRQRRTHFLFLADRQSSQGPLSPVPCRTQNQSPFSGEGAVFCQESRGCPVTFAWIREGRCGEAPVVFPEACVVVGAHSMEAFGFPLGQTTIDEPPGPVLMQATLMQYQTSRTEHSLSQSAGGAPPPAPARGVRTQGPTGAGNITRADPGDLESGTDTRWPAAKRALCMQQVQTLGWAPGRTPGRLQITPVWAAGSVSPPSTAPPPFSIPYLPSWLPLSKRAPASIPASLPQLPSLQAHHPHVLSLSSSRPFTAVLGWTDAWAGTSLAWLSLSKTMICPQVPFPYGMIPGECVQDRCGHWTSERKSFPSAEAPPTPRPHPLPPSPLPGPAPSCSVGPLHSHLTAVGQHRPGPSTLVPGVSTVPPGPSRRHPWATLILEHFIQAAKAGVPVSREARVGGWSRTCGAGSTTSLIPDPVGADLCPPTLSHHQPRWLDLMQSRVACYKCSARAGGLGVPAALPARGPQREEEGEAPEEREGQPWGAGPPKGERRRPVSSRREAKAELGDLDRTRSEPSQLRALGLGEGPPVSERPGQAGSSRFTPLSRGQAQPRILQPGRSTFRGSTRRGLGTGGLQDPRTQAHQAALPLAPVRACMLGAGRCSHSGWRGLVGGIRQMVFALSPETQLLVSREERGHHSTWEGREGALPRPHAGLGLRITRQRDSLQEVPDPTILSTNLQTSQELIQLTWGSRQLIFSFARGSEQRSGYAGGHAGVSGAGCKPTKSGGARLALPSCLGSHFCWGPRDGELRPLDSMGHCGFREAQEGPLPTRASSNAALLERAERAWPWGGSAWWLPCPGEPPRGEAPAAQSQLSLWLPAREGGPQTSHIISRLESGHLGSTPASVQRQVRDSPLGVARRHPPLDAECAVAPAWASTSTIGRAAGEAATRRVSPWPGASPGLLVTQQTWLRPASSNLSRHVCTLFMSSSHGPLTPGAGGVWESCPLVSASQRVESCPSSHKVDTATASRELIRKLLSGASSSRSSEARGPPSWGEGGPGQAASEWRPKEETQRGEGPGDVGPEPQSPVEPLGRAGVKRPICPLSGEQTKGRKPDGSLAAGEQRGWPGPHSGGGAEAWQGNGGPALTVGFWMLYSVQVRLQEPASCPGRSAGEQVREVGRRGPGRVTESRGLGAAGSSQLSLSPRVAPLQGQPESDDFSAWGLGQPQRLSGSRDPRGVTEASVGTALPPDFLLAPGPCTGLDSDPPRPVSLLEHRSVPFRGVWLLQRHTERRSRGMTEAQMRTPGPRAPPDRPSRRTSRGTDPVAPDLSVWPPELVENQETEADPRQPLAAKLRLSTQAGPTSEQRRTKRSPERQGGSQSEHEVAGWGYYERVAAPQAGDLGSEHRAPGCGCRKAEGGVQMWSWEQVQPLHPNSGAGTPQGRDGKCHVNLTFRLPVLYPDPLLCLVQEPRGTEGQRQGTSAPAFTPRCPCARLLERPLAGSSTIFRLRSPSPGPLSHWSVHRLDSGASEGAEDLGPVLKLWQVPPPPTPSRVSPAPPVLSWQSPLRLSAKGPGRGLGSCVVCGPAATPWTLKQPHHPCPPRVAPSLLSPRPLTTPLPHRDTTVAGCPALPAEGPVIWRRLFLPSQGFRALRTRRCRPAFPAAGSAPSALSVSLCPCVPVCTCAAPCLSVPRERLYFCLGRCVCSSCTEPHLPSQNRKRRPGLWAPKAGLQRSLSLAPVETQEGNDPWRLLQAGHYSWPGSSGWGVVSVIACCLEGGGWGRVVGGRAFRRGRSLPPGGSLVGGSPASHPPPRAQATFVHSCRSLRGDFVPALLPVRPDPRRLPPSAESPPQGRSPGGQAAPPRETGDGQTHHVGVSGHVPGLWGSPREQGAAERGGVEVQTESRVSPERWRMVISEGTTGRGGAMVGMERGWLWIQSLRHNSAPPPIDDGSEGVTGMAGNRPCSGRVPGCCSPLTPYQKVAALAFRARHVPVDECSVSRLVSARDVILGVHTSFKEGACLVGSSPWTPVWASCCLHQCLLSPAGGWGSTHFSLRRTQTGSCLFLGWSHHPGELCPPHLRCMARCLCSAHTCSGPGGRHRADPARASWPGQRQAENLGRRASSQGSTPCSPRGRRAALDTPHPAGLRLGTPRRCPVQSQLPHLHAGWSLPLPHKPHSKQGHRGSCYRNGVPGILGSRCESNRWEAVAWWGRGHCRATLGWAGDVSRAPGEQLVRDGDPGTSRPVNTSTLYTESSPRNCTLEGGSAAPTGYLPLRPVPTSHAQPGPTSNTVYLRCPQTSDPWTRLDTTRDGSERQERDKEPASCRLPGAPPQLGPQETPGRCSDDPDSGPPALSCVLSNQAAHQLNSEQGEVGCQLGRQFSRGRKRLGEAALGSGSNPAHLGRLSRLEGRRPLVSQVSLGRDIAGAGAVQGLGAGGDEGRESHPSRYPLQEGAASRAELGEGCPLLAPPPPRRPLPLPTDTPGPLLGGLGWLPSLSDPFKAASSGLGLPFAKDPHIGRASEEGGRGQRGLAGVGAVHSVSAREQLPSSPDPGTTLREPNSEGHWTRPSPPRPPSEELSMDRAGAPPTPTSRGGPHLPPPGGPVGFVSAEWGGGFGVWMEDGATGAEEAPDINRARCLQGWGTPRRIWVEDGAWDQVSSALCDAQTPEVTPASSPACGGNCPQEPHSVRSQVQACRVVLLARVKDRDSCWLCSAVAEADGDVGLTLQMEVCCGIDLEGGGTTCTWSQDPREGFGEDALLGASWKVWPEDRDYWSCPGSSYALSTRLWLPRGHPGNLRGRTSGGQGKLGRWGRGQDTRAPHLLNKPKVGYGSRRVVTPGPLFPWMPLQALSPDWPTKASQAGPAVPQTTRPPSVWGSDHASLWEPRLHRIREPQSPTRTRTRRPGLYPLCPFSGVFPAADN
ncbi:hypothetical protein Cadr_000020852 [Camelus dromedarius]|uniref:Uncharacterized protein n=1 Tax=Camelus dromedarius TaxID=9838 RepID=A0A5N4CU00_CAMDR|nr:hypothetical protein Cadr_000020852 [Camelus dromedarius]